MRILKLNDKNINYFIKKTLEERNNFKDKNLDQKVKKIILDVKKNGDEALIKYSHMFDNIKLNKTNIKLNVNKKITNINLDILNSFKKAITNISRFHRKQLPKNIIQNENNITLKSLWKPIDSVGLYVPGGEAFYPSSLIMNAVPAKIAGVKRIVCITPPTRSVNPYFLALLKELNITETYFVGGAQAIAGLAIGTKTIKPVNKIFGPGNAYVAEAKKQLFGKVGIDLIAGPSEIVVVAEKENNPKWVAADLMAQAEHDINAQSILITDNNKFAKNVLNEIKYLSKNISRKKIIEKSLKKNGLIILVKKIDQCANIINEIAPEHLHIHIKSYNKLLSKINNAGGIFLGDYSAEAFGDYIAGTNHVLPTLGTSKFSSGLSVLDFMKRTSHVKVKKNDYDYMAKHVVNMSNSEGLTGHSLSVKIRQKVEKKI